MRENVESICTYCDLRPRMRGKAHCGHPSCRREASCVRKDIIRASKESKGFVQLIQCRPPDFKYENLIIQKTLYYETCFKLIRKAGFSPIHVNAQKADEILKTHRILT